MLFFFLLKMILVAVFQKGKYKRWRKSTLVGSHGETSLA
jgi:hypothetical protein